MVTRLLQRRPVPPPMPVRRQLADMLSMVRNAYRLAIVTLFHGVPVEDTAGPVRQLVDDLKVMDVAARTRLAAQPVKRGSEGDLARIVDCAAACSAVARIGDVCVDLVEMAGATPDLAGSCRVEHRSAEAESVADLIRRTVAVVIDPSTSSDSHLTETREWQRRLDALARDDLTRAPSPDRAASALFHRGLAEIVADLVLVTEVAIGPTGVADDRLTGATPSGT